MGKGQPLNLVELVRAANRSAHLGVSTTPSHFSHWVGDGVGASRPTAHPWEGSEGKKGEVMHAESSGCLVWVDEGIDDAPSPVDVSGGTVRVRIRQIGTETILKTITTTITDATNGKVAMTFPSDTFPAAGVYEAEVEFTKSNNDIQTVVDLIKFNVREDFD